MKNTQKNERLYHWIPRVLGIAIAVFLALFATAEPFALMQLVPSFLILLVVLIAWKKDLLGLLGFLVLGILATFFFHTYTKTLNFVIISVPFFLVSVFYLRNFLEQKKA